MPDLSFFPESYLVELASADPTGFGRTRKGEIARLVEIADLAVEPFEQAEGRLNAALRSVNPWERYWGMIVCSCFAKRASSLADRAREIAAQDENSLVRVRAAEFLGLIAAADPRPVVLNALAQSRSGVEASLILNSVVLLRDGDPGYDFALTIDRIDTGIRNFDSVLRRLEYLGMTNFSGKSDLFP
jgi:hypothetical protein